ncbi:hypothetical protein VIGAN_02183100 [Vigna angularis var. angularis]|uniref:Uncharacterized protein n=1 Tax=Vigna angularis var. angularis TaxID=157739 RepID=A0A0S3REC4_PHAAN|nr:hypothetical protein VIGAN_02183100 [Vigna angularis var. angularis]
MLTRREFTANSSAAFVSESPLCAGKKEVEEGYLFHSNFSNGNNYFELKYMLLNRIIIFINKIENPFFRVYYPYKTFNLMYTN